jgi:signal peptidase II
MQAVPSSRYAIFLALAAGGCAADLLSKRWIFKRLGMPHEQPTEWLWDHVFGFTTSLNEGALFGIGQGQVSLFAGLSILAAIAIVYWLFFAGAASDLLLTIALGCVAAGILGNFYDRLGLPGLTWDRLQTLHPQGTPVLAVRDWLHFQIDDRHQWPIFNIADSLLVFGAALLTWHAFKAETRPASAASADAPASTSSPTAG